MLALPDHPAHNLPDINNLSNQPPAERAWHQTCSGRCPMTVSFNQVAAVLLFGMCLAASVSAQDAAQTPPAPSSPETAQPRLMAMTCSSNLGERTECPVDTAAGVVLVRSTGDAPCLLGKNLGLRPEKHLGVGRLQRGVCHRCPRDRGRRRIPARRRTSRTPASCSSTMRRARCISAFSPTGGI